MAVRVQWWHYHGLKMHVRQLDRESKRLDIAGSAAKAVIRRTSLVYPDAKGWLVDWEVIQSCPYDEVVRGRRQFNEDELAAAFGLTDNPGKHGQWLLERFGGDSAEQGQYIRSGNFLNIPCPGTGHDGDPNVSIYLDEEIKEAVRQLLGLHR